MLKDWVGETVKQYFFRLFPIVVIFVAALYNPSDSDLGWHLKYGEYFFRHGFILRENIFSTMMPGYHWINSSWMTDLITYMIYHVFGFFGLTILGALVVSLTFYFLSRAARLTFFEQAVSFVLVNYYISPLTVVSFRGQLVTLLFTAILYYILSRFERADVKFIYLTLPLFILWSNIHGGFIMGLGILIVWTILYLGKETVFLYKTDLRRVLSQVRILVLITIGAGLATLVNPFGVDVFQEAIRHFGNPWQKYIVEWLPLESYSELWWQLIIWGVVLMLGIIVIIMKKQLRQKAHYIMIAVLFYIMSLWMRRYAWPMYLVSIPVIQPLIGSFKIGNKSVTSTIAVLVLFAYYLFLVLYKNPLENFATMSWDRYCEQYGSCSPGSAEFLIRADLQGKRLTFYNWGGWLIWNYPQLKPSIDGRMHLWEDHGYSAFAEYYPLEQNWQDIDSSDYDVVYMTPKKPLYNRLLTLVKQGKWQLVYRDPYAGVFLRRK